MSEAMVAQQASYFFLSYAHSPPLTGTSWSEPDRWVKIFFLDLSSSIQRLRSRTLDIAPGYFDQEIPLSDGWRASLARALSRAESFVPLYAPAYFARSWPGREWACFQQRMLNAGIAEPLERFMPVLWVPLKPGENPVGLAKALDLGSAESSYAENGLRAMLRLTPYRKQYLRIVERLATRIIELAEHRMILPSLAPDIDKIRSPFSSVSAAKFAIVVSAPAAWRPFQDGQELSAYAATVAEQLDFAVHVSELAETAEELSERPGIVVIDPSYAADSKRLNMLRRAFTDRPWVVPVLVVNPAGGPSVDKKAQRVRDMLHKIKQSQTDSAQQAVAGVTTLDQFVALMPFLVAEAERQFRRHGPFKRSPGLTGLRPRLSGEGTGVPGDEEDSDD